MVMVPAFSPEVALMAVASEVILPKFMEPKLELLVAPPPRTHPVSTVALTVKGLDTGEGAALVGTIDSAEISKAALR